MGERACAVVDLYKCFDKCQEGHYILWLGEGRPTTGSGWGPRFKVQGSKFKVQGLAKGGGREGRRRFSVFSEAGDGVAAGS